jgi:hypothetical protein
MISFASIESKAPPMTSPDSTPESSLTPGPDGGRKLATTPGLAVDPELDRVAVGGGIGIAERLTGGDPELLPDQVDAGDLLADGVLHLQPGVDLQERDDTVLPDEELAGPGAHVLGLLQDGFGGADHLGVLLARQERRGCLLDQLLVAPLQ